MLLPHEDYDTLTLFEYSELPQGDEGVKDFWYQAVRFYFEGAIEPAFSRLGELERNIGDSRVAPLADYALYQFLRFLVLGRLEQKAEADRALAAGMECGGVPGECSNDLAVVLARAGRIDLAGDFLDSQSAASPEDLVMKVNLLALSVAGEDGARVTRLISEARGWASVIVGKAVESGALGVDVRSPAFSVLKTFLTAALRWLRDAEWRDDAPSPQAMPLAQAVFDLINGFDRLPALTRDAYFQFMFRVALVDAEAVRRCLAFGIGTNARSSPAVSVFAACLDYSLCVPGAEEALSRLRGEDGGVLHLLGLALSHGEKEDLDLEYACLNRVLERIDPEPNVLFHAANNRFRAGDLDAAGEFARTALSLCDEGTLENYYGPARESAGQLEEAIAKGATERPRDIDPYANSEWVEGFWDRYHFEFSHFTPRQEFSVFLNRLYTDSVEDLIREHPEIRSVINFGSFCGYFELELALRHNCVTVFGYDRDRDAVDMSKRHFSADNLRFRSGDWQGVLAEATDIGPTVVAHVRTCSMLYPAGVGELYGRCREAGVAYLVGVEHTGYSYQMEAFPDPFDEARPSVVPFGVTVDHPYPRFVKEAGYRMVRHDLHVYPIIVPLRELQHQVVPMRFVAERR